MAKGFGHGTGKDAHPFFGGQSGRHAALRFAKNAANPS
jgi:hypothetical protein